MGGRLSEEPRILLVASSPVTAPVDEKRQGHTLEPVALEFRLRRSGFLFGFFGYMGVSGESWGYLGYLGYLGRLGVSRFFGGI